MSAPRSVYVDYVVLIPARREGDCLRPSEGTNRSESLQHFRGSGLLSSTRVMLADADGPAFVCNFKVVKKLQESHQISKLLEISAKLFVAIATLFVLCALQSKDRRCVSPQPRCAELCRVITTN